MKTRLDLLDLMPPDSICAELGVFKGEFSTEILKRCDPVLFYLVDSFDGNVQSGDVNGENYQWQDMELMMLELQERYKLNPHVEVIRSISWDWLATIPESSLDWAYIDTSHSLRATTRELEGCWRVVKPGGYICGHDWHPGYFPEVVRAVYEFCEKYHLTKTLTTEDKLASYMIQKPVNL